MKNIFKRIKTPKLDNVTKEDRTRTPWVISKVVNGLKAVNGKPAVGQFFINKKLPIQYYEYDRIFGKGAWSSNGVLRVTDLFDELKDLTPYTEYFVYGEYDYINRDDGILKKHHRTKAELFYSNETLQNENLANYFSLAYNDEPEIKESEIEIDETDTDRTEIHNKSTELQKI